ncbi:MAG: hypothetical protein Fues2KO_54120 [Fuerstiella sp.]
MTLKAIHHFRILVGFFLAVACLQTSVCHAGVITVQDPGFETRVITGDYSNFSSSDAWNVSGGAGAGIARPPGNEFPGLNAAAGSQFGASLNAPFFQVLSHNFDPGLTYRLEFDVAPSTSNAAGSGYRATLATVDGGILKQQQVLFASTTWTSGVLEFDPTVEGYQPIDVGSPLRLIFGGYHPSSIADSAAFDNISLTSSASSAVPEPPSGLMLFGMALIGVIRVGRIRSCRNCFVDASLCVHMKRRRLASVHNRLRMWHQSSE